jgi:hypothetical protein
MVALLLVMPDDSSRDGVEREDLAARRGKIQHAAYGCRRSLNAVIVIARLKCPDRNQFLYVVRVDLVKSAVAPRELGSAVVRPFVVCRAILPVEGGERHEECECRADMVFRSPFGPRSGSIIPRLFARAARKEISSAIPGCKPERASQNWDR